MRGVPTTLDLAGCRIYLKFENLQYTASFKERGACNKLLLLTEEERKAEDFLILGVAEGYGEACEVVRTMVDDMYRHTDGFNWKSYMSYLGETR